MLGFIKYAEAVSVLYKYVTVELSEKDFFELPEKFYKTLPLERQSEELYIVNSNKLRKDVEENFIVNAEEKKILLGAVQFVNNSSAKLPADTSFLERLLYIKKIIPPAFFSS